MGSHSMRGRPRWGRTNRTLSLEPLEARQMLDGFPWQNPVFRLDVNNSSATTPSDALAIINRIRSNGGNPEELPDPGPNPPQFYYDTNGDNRLTTSDLLNVVNGILAPPDLLVSSLTPFTSDVTPLVTVTAAGTPAIADDTVLQLDVDLNGDGDFGDPGEFGHTQSTFFAGSSTFPITPALPDTPQLYSVNLRARVQNAEGVIGASPILPLEVDRLTSDALATYVNTFDPSYTFTPVVSSPNYYLLDMISQTWRSTADVNLPVWHHWVELYVPTTVVFDTALMLVDGGSNTSGPPSPTNELASLAEITGSVIVNLKIVPNEPVIFTDETRSRSEDAIIAYTFDKYMEHLGEPGNETWPLLLPMVKSAVRAMDTVQAFVPTVRPGVQVSEFLVGGGSKRGWTTWLTAAVDDRVRAIIPAVIDVLNIAPQMVHHYGAYGSFSYAIGDYQEMQIFDRMFTPEGRELFRIVDPYRYLNNGRFDDMPKLILNSAGDEFFVSDSAQFYFDDIPGETNLLRYIPNTSHGLELGEVFTSVLSFYATVLGVLEVPDYSWTVDQDGSIRVRTSTVPSEVRLWQATNPDVRDFRHQLYPNLWTSSVLQVIEDGAWVGNVPVPADGATAYFVELTFDNPGFLPYVFTTEIRVQTNLALHPWPFEVDAPAADAALALPAVDEPARAALAVALAMPVDASPTGSGSLSVALPPDEPVALTPPPPPAALLLPEVLAGQQAADESDVGPVDAAAADALFGSLLAELVD